MQFDLLQNRYRSVVIVNATSDKGNLLAGLIFCESRYEIETLTDSDTGMEITIEIPEELRTAPTFTVGYDVPLNLLAYNT